MKIGIIGTGSVGQTFAPRLIELGHEVMMGTRNVEAKKADAAFSRWHESNKIVRLGTFAEAAAFGEIVLNVTHGGSSIQALKLAEEKNLSGKIIIDIANPLDASNGMPPVLIKELSNTNSLGEEIQKTFPDAKVVKTMNTMWAGIMVNPKMIDNGNHTAFICGNNDGAKATVKALMNEFGWENSSILDIGDISASRGTEAILPVWLRIWGARQNAAFNFMVVG